MGKEATLRNALGGMLGAREGASERPTVQDTGGSAPSEPRAGRAAAPRKADGDDPLERTTFVVRRSTARRIRIIAIKNGRTFKDEIAEALEGHIERWEREHPDDRL